jgi:hypothetical protein
MKKIWREFSFLAYWVISRLLTDVFYTPFVEGALGNIVCLGKELICDYFLLHFLFITVRQVENNAVKSEKRLYERLEYYRQISVTVLANNMNLIADTVNRSQRGLMLVLDKHMKRYAKKGMILSIENELYRIVWNHTKGMQYHIGLQRQ